MNMTDDEINALAEKMILEEIQERNAQGWVIPFARAIAAAEREACADLCHKFIWAHGDVAKLCEEAIRARGET